MESHSFSFVLFSTLRHKTFTVDLRELKTQLQKRIERQILKSSNLEMTIHKRHWKFFLIVLREHSLTSMLLACHKKSYLTKISKLEISKYYVIFVYFQAAVSALLPLLPVSVLYVEQKIKIKYYAIFRDF